MDFESWLKSCTSRYKGFNIGPVTITREAKDGYPECQIIYYTPLETPKSERREIAIPIIESWLKRRKMNAEQTQSTVNGRDCNHGQLARSCNICDLEQEVANLKSASEEEKETQ